MANENRQGIRRGEMAFIVAIIIGLAIGVLIKKVRIGLLIGLILGGLIVFTGWIRATRR